MIFKIPTLIDEISKVMRLQEGDLILTGTPSGVGPVVAGQTIKGTLKDAAGNVITSIEFAAEDRK
jgi:acylpyruvate hydrolase